MALPGREKSPFPRGVEKRGWSVFAFACDSLLQGPSVLKYRVTPLAPLDFFLAWTYFLTFLNVFMFFPDVLVYDVSILKKIFFLSFFFFTSNSVSLYRFYFINEVSDKRSSSLEYSPFSYNVIILGLSIYHTFIINIFVRDETHQEALFTLWWYLLQVLGYFFRLLLI